MKIFLRIGAVLVLLLFFGLMLVYAAGEGLFGNADTAGEVVEQPRPSAEVLEIAGDQRSAAREIGVREPKQVLFGDFHVHTTFSFDAFMMSLPAASGEGAHPPADACDFARFCSALDFWSVNDHAEYLSESHWDQTVESIRQCNAVGNPENPDTVAFLGWEWTNVGTTPENHYGHKNVVLAHTEEGKIAPRPVAAANTFRQITSQSLNPFGIGFFALIGGHQRYHDLARFFADRADFEACAPGDGPVDYPDNCVVIAEDPNELFSQLDAWDVEAIVIPHGTAWGMYTPAGSSWDKQLTPKMHDPKRQTLFEVYSGHGNSEQYRSWRAVDFDANGKAVCPPVRDNYLPTCQRAGQIVEERCKADGEDAAECAKRAAVARSNAAEAGLQAHLTVPGTAPEEWLDAGQCQDCGMPAFNLRPASSAQYVMALRNFDASEDGEPLRFRFGFMSSSDNHYARSGTGYKEVHRQGFTESRDWGQAATVSAFGAAPRGEPESRSVPFDRENTELLGFQLFEMERQSSYFQTGGLVAAHSAGRQRADIWDALERREVYGTSGQRTLLWFDLLNPPGSRGESMPMGSVVETNANPVFQVRAVGSFEQKPGCPDYAAEALGAEDLNRICMNECYNPSDKRRLITQVDVIRIRPQVQNGESVDALIEDPWRSFTCDNNPEGCVVTFSDPDYSKDGRDTVYYVRVMEESQPTINGAGVNCEFDASGKCASVKLCGSPERPSSECLSEAEPRAWSSPIFLDQPKRALAAAAN